MDTQISVPADLHIRVERQAKALGMSVNEFVRKSLERATSQPRSDDPLFADFAVYPDGPDDVAANHDEYLYGDAS
jgi:hypothetical protein